MNMKQVANTTSKLKLPNVTLIAMTSVKVMETVKALQYSMQGIDFGEVVLVSHRKPLFLPKEITFKYTSKLTNIDDFNYKLVYDLTDYVDTEYCMIVHYDGFIVHPEMWREEFFEYDYIGSPWPDNPDEFARPSFLDSKGNLCRVGNSVSLRSKRLLDYPRKVNLKWEPLECGMYNEDLFLCALHKNEMEDAGMRWAPVDVAKYFAHEKPIPEVRGITPFAFHKWWGENAQYPVFKNPWMEAYKTIKSIVRPLLFWRRLEK